MTTQISPTEVGSGSGAAVRSAYLTNLLNLRQDLDPDRKLAANDSRSRHGDRPRTGDSLDSR